MDNLTKMFSRYLTGWAMSKAILDDYCEIVSKLENISPDIIRKRVMDKTEEYFEKAKEELKPQSENNSDTF